MKHKKIKKLCIINIHLIETNLHRSCLFTVDTPAVEPTWESLPGYLQELVRRDNEKLQRWIKELVDMRRSNVEKGLQRHKQVIDIYSLLPARKGKFFKSLLLNQRSFIPEPTNS